MEKAAFQLTNYTFNHVLFKLPEESGGKTWEVNFTPKGAFSSSTKTFALSVLTQCKLKEQQEPSIVVLCNAIFTFEKDLAFSEIPDYFYTNSIPILYPYIKAFIGTLGMLANSRNALILPTYNLSTLADILRKNTREVE